MTEALKSTTAEGSLRSVNWEHGMLLTPEHFLRQERYLEALAGWGMHYLVPGTGLVGGGIRLPESDLGTVRNDPEVSLAESPEALDISVKRARGITPAGTIVDVESLGAVSGRFPKDQLAGVAEALVYLVAEPGARDKVDGAPDSFNPQMRTERVASYRIALNVTAAERAQSIIVGRLARPATGMQYEADAAFIPPCVALASHSELMAGSRRIVDAVTRLSAGYAELHRAMREFMVLFTERGIDTEVDRDSMQFAERMVLELQDTAYALLDRTQPPDKFFGRIRRMLHSAALYFDLATGMQQYYDTLRETGETELLGLIEQQKHTLQIGRSVKVEENLGLEVRRALQSLSGLENLERALEGKYIDFRKSGSLESTNFIFDRGGKALYKLAARPARVQGVGDEVTLFFSNLRLEGRDRYRLILVGDRNTPWLRGTSIGAEIRLNEGSGFRRESLILSGDVKLDVQYNLELDFEAPDVPTITDLRVTVPAYHTVHTALLFQRHRFYAGQRETNELRPVERELEPAPGLPASAQPARLPEPTYPESRSPQPRFQEPRFQEPRFQEPRFQEPRPAPAPAPSYPPLSPAPPRPTATPAPTEPIQPPWMPRDTPPPAATPSDTQDKPRRRRLE